MAFFSRFDDFGKRFASGALQLGSLPHGRARLVEAVVDGLILYLLGMIKWISGNLTEKSMKKSRRTVVPREREGFYDVLWVSRRILVIFKLNPNSIKKKKLDDYPFFSSGWIFFDDHEPVTNLVTFVTRLGANHLQFGGERTLSYTKLCHMFGIVWQIGIWDLWWFPGISYPITQFGTSRNHH